MGSRSHYEVSGLLDKVFAAIEESGGQLGALEAKELTPVDQFHIGGLPATESLFEMSRLKAGDLVLDIGSGMGGPARFLAQQGCRVIGVDYTASYCLAAAELSNRTGMGSSTKFVCADACRLPFGFGTFDGAWLQHVNMNVADKGSLFSGIARALRSEGRLVFHEIALGSETPRYPTPWAPDERVSFLATTEQLKSAIWEGGLDVEIWLDVTNEARTWFERAISRVPGALGLHLLLGERTPEIMQTMLDNFERDALRVVRGMATKRGRATLAP